jgi:hypothetical protein
MQKNVLLNIAGVAGLALLSGCGPWSEKKATEVPQPAHEQPAATPEPQKEAMAEIPAEEVIAQADVQAAVDTVAMADNSDVQAEAMQNDAAEQKA